MAILEVQNLVKKYKDIEVVKGVSLKVEKGETLVIIGASGSGAVIGISSPSLINCSMRKAIQASPIPS